MPALSTPSPPLGDPSPSHVGTCVVALDGLSDADTARVESFVDLLGAQLWDGVGMPDLVLCGDAATGIEGQAHITIGSGGQITLPADEDLLTHIIVNYMQGGSVLRRVRIFAVAHWDSARLSARIADNLARAFGAVLIDVSGAGPPPGIMRNPQVPGVRWGDICTEETGFLPDLVDMLIEVAGYRLLTGDERAVACVSDARLNPVVDAVSRSGKTLVFDCGTWGAPARTFVESLPLVINGANVGIILVGPSDVTGAVRLAFALSHTPPTLPYVLITEGRGASRIRAATTAPVISLRRAGSRRGVDAIVRALDKVAEKAKDTAAESLTP